MRFTRWINPMLPQTLHIATILFYINAVFGVLFGLAFSPSASCSSSASR